MPRTRTRPRSSAAGAQPRTSAPRGRGRPPPRRSAPSGSARSCPPATGPRRWRRTPPRAAAGRRRARRRARCARPRPRPWCRPGCRTGTRSPPAGVGPGTRRRCGPPRRPRRAGCNRGIRAGRPMPGPRPTPRRSRGLRGSCSHPPFYRFRSLGRRYPECGWRRQLSDGIFTTMEMRLGDADVVDGQTLYVDGKWSAASDGGVFEVTDPATGSVIGHAADAGAADAEQAIGAAAAAFATWSKRTAYERSAALYRAHAIMTERADELARLMTREQGKPLRMARNEVNYGADFLIWFAEEAKRVYGTTIPAPRSDQRFSVLRQPVGVVYGITPWNYPISMITRKVAPAVAAGCTIVLKPAEQTPLCAIEMFKIFDEAGFPPGVVNLLTTDHPAEVSEPLLSSHQVRKLTFTGSTQIGMMLPAPAAPTMKRVSLELGGHAPFLVLEDADVSRAAKGAAMVKFLNTRQACIRPTPLY